MKRKIFTSIIIIILLLVIIFTFVISQNSKGITGQEWFQMQDEYVTALAEYTTTLDNIVSLYINQNITRDDFVFQMNNLYDEIILIEKSYMEDEENNPILINTHTESSLRGCNAVKNTIIEVKSLVEDLLKDNNVNDIDSLSYTYLAYTQTIQDYMQTYMASYTIENYQEIYEGVN